jgi:hypothetical protein
LEVPPAEVGDYDIWLYSDAGGRPNLEDFEESRAPAGVNELIEAPDRRPGRYWVRVWGVGGKQIEEPYRLIWSHLDKETPPTPAD